MKVVLDTNIFISAFFWGGNPRRVLERSIEGIDELFTSREILEELCTVLKRPKFKIENYNIEYYVKAIEDIAKIVVISGIVKNQCRDHNDDKILECAYEGNVEYIVTGDDDLLVLKEFRTIKICRVNEYLEIVKDRANFI